MTPQRLAEIERRTLDRLAQNDRNADPLVEPWNIIWELLEFIKKKEPA